MGKPEFTAGPASTSGEKRIVLVLEVLASLLADGLRLFLVVGGEVRLEHYPPAVVDCVHSLPQSRGGAQCPTTKARYNLIDFAAYGTMIKFVVCESRFDFPRTYVVLFLFPQRPKPR